jgi:nucleotidyltransferase AbiEii toxin of type IV toxin-antitoxin system
MTLGERLRALHGALEAAGIPHAFGGAVALAYWTLEPRGTRDIDINVFVDPEDAERVLSALPAGVERPERSARLIRRNGQIRLWWDDTPVDLFFDYDPIHHDAASHRQTVPFEGAQIPILGPTELAVFKAMFDRTRDWADIESMVEAGQLDVDAVRAILTRMLGPSDPRFAKLDDAVAKGTRASGTP